MCMKSLHRSKAIEAYEGARLVLKKGLVYPGYVLLKEATRSVLAYINEDVQGKEYSEKTKMRTLLEEVPAELEKLTDLSVFDIFVEMDTAGLGAILTLDIVELEKIRKVLKKTMGIYMQADL